MIEQLVNEALDMGFQARSDVITYVMQRHLAECRIKTVCIKNETVTVDDFCQRATELAAELSKLPRGHYGLLSFEHKGKTFWKALVSDGTGSTLKPEQFALYNYAPPALSIVRDLVTSEVMEKVEDIAFNRTVELNLKIMAEEDLHEGAVIKNVTVPGFKAFSRVTVERISKHTGVVELIGRYRGSPRQFKMTVPASHLQIAH